MLRREVGAALSVLGGVALAATAWWACATTPETGPPLADPAAVAADAVAGSGADRPVRIRFRWEYGDEDGRLSGDGVARINPPDSFRLDLFTAGEGSMAVALADDTLTTLGQIEDLELPTTPFLYAMAGVFRPGGAAPAEGFETGEGIVLAYGGDGERTRRYFFEGERLVRVEERAGSRVVRRISVEWGEDAEWPDHAEYRDREERRRVVWTLEAKEAVAEPHPGDIYDLGGPPPAPEGSR